MKRNPDDVSSFPLFSASRIVLNAGFRPASGRGTCFAKPPFTPKATPTASPAGPLRFSPNAAAAELGLRPQTVLAELPRLAAMLGWLQGIKVVLTTAVIQ
ncbi:MAG: hypothetical protein P4L87_17180 [Formivibrio sp.]|nr:hypothetical protein [Formivibrio sp.]